MVEDVNLPQKMVQMEEENSKSEIVWSIIGKSIRGTSHVRNGLPNQDSVKWLPESGKDLPIILAVSDGHGGDKHFRSDIGSLLAVEAALLSCNTFLENQLNSSSLSLVKHYLEENLPSDIVRNWRNLIADDIIKKSFANKEIDQLKVKKSIDTGRQVVLDPILAYGATILTVIVTKSFIVYLQLGDGDILTVSEKGEVSRPLPEDKRLLGNETSSLCDSNPWRDFRVYFQILSEIQTAPALILVSTDGYSNSFREPQGFLQVGSDILKIIHSDGINKVNKNLEMWLSEASNTGSGDDISLGIISRIDSFKQPAEIVQSNQQLSKLNGIDKIKQNKKVDIFFIRFIRTVRNWLYKILGL